MTKQQQTIFDNLMNKETGLSLEDLLKCQLDYLNIAYTVCKRDKRINKQLHTRIISYGHAIQTKLKEKYE